MLRFGTLFFVLGILFFIDLYAFQAIKALLPSNNLRQKRLVYAIYWGVTVLSFAALIAVGLVNNESMRAKRAMLMTFLAINYFSKTFVILFLIIDDLIRLGKWVAQYFSPQRSATEALAAPLSELAKEEADTITRSDFIVKSALIAGVVPLTMMTFGIVSGAHDYRVRRKTIYLPNLPKEFDGIRLAQLSDIHSGSFFNKTAVQGGVEMLLAEKPDIAFFTGDLVNNEATEVKDYINIFEKVKAPLGVYSVLGNHDYGDYMLWDSPRAKVQNLQDLKEAHRLMGWQLLCDEHRDIRVGGEQISIVGVENWGTGRFPKYGNLQNAQAGTKESPFKILLSHDPSHWDAQVRPQYKDIDLTLSGHTHGMQFGIEIGDFRWSPVQYRYKQWADLYENEGQYLYVNRGFGYIGYPGRIGILPEITILTLKKA
jgi:predicted MPP superfamily phosphohydrolase